MINPPKPRNPFQKTPNLTHNQIVPNPFGNFSSNEQINLENPALRPENKIPPTASKRNPFAPPEVSKLIANPLAQMGYEYSKNHINELISQTQNSYKSFIFNSTTRAYFDIDQEILLKKIGFSLFPFLIFENSDSEKETRHQMFKPEFYLPIMSIITFVMLGCLKTIFEGGRIEPLFLINEVFGCGSFAFLEGLLCMTLLFFGSKIMVSYFDSVSFCGYKYVLYAN